MKPWMFWIAAALTAATILNGSARTGGALEREPSRWALLIGVDDYTELRKLRFAGNDQRALAEQLETLGFPQDQIHLLNDKASDKLHLPTQRNIEKRLDQVLGMAGRGDLVIVGFSGHGVELDGKSYLCPEDARLDKLAETAIPLAQVYARLDKCKAAVKLLLVDACRNDVVPEGRRSIALTRSLGGFSTAKETLPEGIMQLTSCAAGQVSWEDDKLGHGVFMHFVIEGLQGQAANQGRITLAGLYDYASLETKKHVDRRFSDLQTPAMEGKISGPFVICPNIAFRTITNSIGMKLVLIPPGEFMMGSSESPEELAAAFAPYGAKVRDFQSGGRALEDKYQSKSIDVLNRSRGLLTPEQQRALDEATNKAVKAARAAGKEVDALSIVLDSLESITLTSDQEDSVGASLKELRQLAKERDEARAKLPSVIPWHRVQITKSYCIGAYEVTVGQFRRFVRETGYRTEAETDGRGGMGYDWATDKYEPKNIYNWKNPGYEQTDRHPVVNMSWNDANAFCRWLSKKENREYRLPTEAEWEYACRAGTETRFYNGNDPERVAEVGNVADASLKAKAAKWKGCMRASDGYPCAAPVGSFKPNAWGLYDMHGNAREWCADWYGEDYYRTCSGQDPKGPASGSKRIIRGGSWWLGPQWAFSAWRLMEPPEDCCDCLGFRVVRTP